MPHTPDAVIRQWFKEVWDEGREDAIDRLASPNAVIHGLSGPDGPPMSPADFKKLYHTFRDALGDVTVSVEKTVTQGDTCAAYCLVRGRHVGDGFGHAFGDAMRGRATQKPVSFNGVAIAVVRDGRIVEGWNCFDFLSMYQQIGWVKNPPLP